MINLRQIVIGLFTLVEFTKMASAQASDPWHFYAEQPFYEHHDMKQEFLIIVPDSFTTDVNIRGYLFGANGDSTLLYQDKIEYLHFERGINNFVVDLVGDKQNFLHQKWAKLIRDYHQIPGTYRYEIHFTSPVDGDYERHIYQYIDSNLTDKSILYQKVKGGLDFRNPFLNKVQRNKPSAQNEQKFLELFTNNLERKLNKFCKGNDLEYNYHLSKDVVVIELYKKDWYLGRIRLEQSAGRDKNSRLKVTADNRLSSPKFQHPQLLSTQFREVFSSNDQIEEFEGRISLSSNWGVGADAYSSEEKNYQEIEGAFSFSVLGIPVAIEGFYTTQDWHKRIKSSRVHFHYDVDATRTKLLKILVKYRERYEQANAMGIGNDGIYQQFTEKLIKERDARLNEIQEEFGGVKDNSVNTLTSIRGKLEELKTQFADSLSPMPIYQDSLTVKSRRIQQESESLKSVYQRLLSNYQKVKSLEQKIVYYRGLLNRQKDVHFYDSALLSDKINLLKNLDDLSNKDLYRKTESLIPKGSGMKFKSSLSQFDLGMFSPYLSDYTLAGQQLTGGNIEYDINYAKIGVTYGTTDYIDADGGIITYRARSGHVSFKPFLKQKLGVVYYQYQPGARTLHENNFFKTTETSLPSFRNAVQIYSIGYDGGFSRYFHLSSTYAFSNIPNQSIVSKRTLSLKEESAYNFKFQGQIPKSTMSFEMTYEHVGHSFENNTLSLLMSGMDLLTVTGRGDVFRSIISYSVDYNLITQKNMNMVGKNKRFGFEVSTHNRRIPNLRLSYKPFSTFHKFSDTLMIPQRPIFGSVWTGQMNYQIRKLDKAWRFNIIYNRNVNVSDTFKYRASLAQVGVIYSSAAAIYMMSGGHSRMSSSDLLDSSAINNNDFVNMNAAIPLKKGYTVSVGGDLGWGRGIVNKIGCVTTMEHSFKNYPIMIQLNLRWSDYKSAIESNWSQIFRAGVQVTWRFKSQS